MFKCENLRSAVGARGDERGVVVNVCSRRTGYD